MSIQAAIRANIRLDALSYAQKYWEAIDTATSLSCYLMTKYHEYEQLVRKSINPLSYVDPLSFFLDYQSVKILSKYPYLDTKIDTKKVAKSKFDDAESLCRRTNHRFRMRDEGYLFGSSVERVLSNASRKIAHILGDVPSFEQMDFSFGPGAAYGVRGETSVFNKVTSALECSYAMTGILQEFLEEFPGWIPPGIHEVTLIPGSQLTFVPKDAKTDRPICIEPLLNGLMQKGIGTWLRKRLRSFGINLDDQGVNQKLASEAFRCHLATVDFSSASDTIAYRLVMDLLPHSWFEFLEVARCPRYEHEGKWYNFHKFTSMGNAYTFELETLIFYSIAHACCEELGIEVRTGANLSVYGDDVIIPRDAFDLFSEVTVACGFELNQEKSFSKGSFFESCGHDYFDGTFVRPFLLKKRPNKLLPAFYAANTIRRFQSRLKLCIPQRPWESYALACKGGWRRVLESLLRRFDGVYSWVVGCIPRGLRVVGPEGYGDGHLIGELDEAVTSRPSRVTRHRQFDGWWFRSYSERAVKIEISECHPGYALYFTRFQRGDDDDLPRLSSFVEPLDNGSAYTVRNRTRLVLQRILCHSSWQGYKSEFWISSVPHTKETWDCVVR